ncbi:MAG: hypothetical protein AAGA96_08075 [Verrucomicrobiota bacterium]
MDPESPTPTLESFEAEARANLIWGHSSDEVRQFLLENGLYEKEADRIVREGIEERHHIIRRRGIRRLVIGVMLIGLGSVLAYFALEKYPYIGQPTVGRGFGGYSYVEIESWGIGFAYRPGWVFIVGMTLSLLGFLFGLKESIEGSFEVVRPQNTLGSLSTSSGLVS